MSNWVTAQPANLDTIPREVAIEMLASPKAKLTARDRKNCFAALQKVFCSSSPLRRPEGGEYQVDVDWHPEPPEAKLARKLHPLPLAKLGIIRKRSLARRRSVQQAFAKLLLLNQSDRRIIRLKAALEAKAASLEMLFDVTQAEITFRNVPRVDF